MRRLLIVFALLATLAPPALARGDITARNKPGKGGNTVYYLPPPPHLPDYQLIRDPGGNYYWSLSDGDWTHWAAQTANTGKAPTRSMGPGVGQITYNGGINLAAMAASPSKAGFSRGGGTAYRPLVLAQHNHAPGDCPDDSCPDSPPAPSNPAKPKADPDEPQSSDPIDQFLIRRGVNPTYVFWGVVAFAVVFLLGAAVVGLLILVVVVMAFRRRNP
jgi:hypothetical protein